MTVEELRWRVAIARRNLKNTQLDLQQAENALAVALAAFKPGDMIVYRYGLRFRRGRVEAIFGRNCEPRYRVIPIHLDGREGNPTVVGPWDDPELAP